MTEEITSAIIIDTGSGFLKSGLAQTDFPSVCSPTITAALREGKDFEKNKKIFGNDVLNLAYNKKQQEEKLYDISRPIQKGFVKNWDDLELVWHNMYLKLLKVNSANHPILTSIYPDEQKQAKERIVQIFFETFNVPGFYFSIDSLFSLYGSGKTTGMVIDSGFGVTTAVPIIDGYCHSYAHLMMKQGGSDINEYLGNALSSQQGLSLSEPVIEEIKKAQAYIALDYQKELKAFEEGTCDPVFYDLPDGTKVRLGSELIKSTELVFNPRINGLKELGIADMVYESAQKLELEKRKDLFNNIILSGGNTKLQNFTKRLAREITFRVPGGFKVKMQAGNDRQFLTWMGASVVSALSTFQTMWITQTDYDESGPSIVYRKCL